MDSQTCPALYVKQMPPVLGQFPLTTTQLQRVNKFTARTPNVRGEAYTEWWMKQSPLPNAEWGLMRSIKWFLDLGVGFKAVFSRQSSGTPGGLTHNEGHRISYDEVDVLYRNMCCDIMLFVPHQHSVMPQDVTLVSSVALFFGQIFNL